MNTFPKTATGETFSVEVHEGKPIDDFRSEAQKIFGMRVFIGARIGPVADDGTCPVCAVDAAIPKGVIDQRPAEPGMVIYTGVFIENNPANRRGDAE
jgi:hypothetical protein